jgi:hypothetical protein
VPVNRSIENVPDEVVQTPREAAALIRPDRDGR